MRWLEAVVGAEVSALATACVLVWATEVPAVREPPPRPSRLTPGEAGLVRDRFREAGNRATVALGDAARLEGERDRLAAENARLRLDLDALRRGEVRVGEPDAETIPAPKVPIPER